MKTYRLRLTSVDYTKFYNWLEKNVSLSCRRIHCGMRDDVIHFKNEEDYIIAKLKFGGDSR